MTFTSPGRAALRPRAMSQAYVRTARIQLIGEVLQVVKSRRLVASAVTESLSVPPERVPALLHGDIDEFTVDELIRMLAHADVELELRKTSPVDEEAFNGPLVSASGADLYAALHARLTAMAARYDEAMAADVQGKGLTLEQLVETVGRANVRLMFVAV